jgi:transcriptional regulator with XRE-family HTH domain
METPDDQIRKRINQIVDEGYDGSQRALADAAGVSQALLSRVISGDRAPSRKLLRAIGSLPQINAKWLETGKGKPLQTQPQILTDLGALVPFAKQLLPGTPLQFEHLLRSLFIAVPRQYFGEDVYAISVNEVVDAGQFATDALQNNNMTREDTLIIGTDPGRCKTSRHKLQVIRTVDDRVALTFGESAAAVATSTPSKKTKSIEEEVLQSCQSKRAIFLDDDAPSPSKKRTVIVGFVTLLMREY